jgi:hypothetical protein
VEYLALIVVGVLLTLVLYGFFVKENQVHHQQFGLNTLKEVGRCLKKRVLRFVFMI